MTQSVTKESLIARIADLEYGARSLKEDYTLAAYKMLLATMEAEPVAYSLIFRNMDGALNNYINTNTTFATRAKAEAYGKGGAYETRGDGRLEWVPNTALDPVVVPLYRHAQPAVVLPDFDNVLESLDYEVRCNAWESEHVLKACQATYDACRAAMLKAYPVCTCPSGDGSLRWPCPVHPGNSPVVPDGLPDGVNIYHGPKEKTILVLKQDAAVNQDCWCRTCRPVAINDMRFVVCPDCGNKRCPRANDHRNACTGSNETGQEGSAYPAAPQEVKHG
ncbi:TPA: hypothetical protein ACYVCF_003096 [Klebsiella pneumoniae]